MASFLSRLNPHGNHLQVGAVRRAADAAAASASTAAAAAASAAPATAASRAEEEMLLLRTGLADADIIAFVLEADSRGEHRNALFPGLQEACTMYSESQLRERVAYLVLSGRLPEQSQEGMDPRDARAFEAAKRFIEAQAVDEEDAAGFSRKRRSKPAAKAAPKAAAASSRGLQPRKGTAPAGAFPSARARQVVAKTVPRVTPTKAPTTARKSWTERKTGMRPLIGHASSGARTPAQYGCGGTVRISGGSSSSSSSRKVPRRRQPQPPLRPAQELAAWAAAGAPRGRMAGLPRWRACGLPTHYWSSCGLPAWSR